MAPPKKDPAQVKSKLLQFRATAERLAAWQTAAQAAFQHEGDELLDFTAWVTRALSRAATAEAKARDEAAPVKRVRRTRNPYGGPGERALALTWSEGYEAAIADLRLKRPGGSRTRKGGGR